METELELETQQSADRLTISLPERKQSQFSSVEWRTKQLVALAEVFKESLTPESVAMYAESLADLSDAQIRLCIGRAIRELEWFPKPVKLRELAGVGKPEDARKVEANAAWELANRYLQRHGVVKYDRDFITRPALPPRIEYALQRIGGLSGLNQITADSRPFMYRDFCEAYELAPIADFLAPQLEEKFPAKQLLGELQRQLPGKADKRVSYVQPTSATQFVARKIPEPLTESQIRDSREMLRQQRDKLLSKRNSTTIKETFSYEK